VIAILRTELAKQWRRPRTYVALGITVFIPILVAILLKSNPPSAPREDGGFFFFATKSGLVLPAAALRVMSRFLLVIVVALFAGDAIACEASWGNLRALLVRPISRGRLLAAKAISAAFFGFLATALITVVGLGAGVLFFGWHPLDIGSALLGVSFHMSESSIVGNLAISTLYVFWSLSGVVALGIMVSTMTDSPAGAIFAGVGLYIVSQILDGISALGSVRYALPTHYFDAWSDLFLRRGANTDDMVRGALLQIGYVLLFGGIAAWWFRRKDILS
jgi:ABC-2 type transport system permease protein